MTDQREAQQALPSKDNRNIVVGNARVIWVRGDRDYPDGWILPGGERTCDYMRAHAVAVQMHLLMNELKGIKE